MAKHVRTEIEINAPANVVWSILSDFDAVAEWNDFIRHLEGDSTVGSKLVVEIWLADRKPMTFKPRLLAYEANSELRWKGRLLMPGVFDGEHSFVIEPIDDNRVRFVHSETFSGVLVPVMFNGMKKDVVSSFESFNRSLKARAEAASAGPE